MIATDFVGVSALIGSIAAAIVSIIVAFRQTAIGGDARATRAAVHTSNGATIGQIVEANDLTGAAHTDTPSGP